MAFAINTNIASLNAQKDLAATQSGLGKSIDRLSSGLRIRNEAPPSVVNQIDSKMQAAAGALSNANNGITLTQTADGGLAQITGNLQRMRDLAVQSANGTLNASDRENPQKEFTQLNDEIDRLAQTAQINGQNLLDGSFGGSKVQIGSNEVTISAIANTQAAALGRLDSNNADDQGLRSIDLSTQTGAQDAIQRIDSAIKNVDGSRSAMGASMNRISEAIGTITPTQTPASPIPNREEAQELSRGISDRFRDQIEAGKALLAQANVLPQMALSLLRG